MVRVLILLITPVGTERYLWGFHLLKGNDMKLWSLIRINADGAINHVYSYSEPGKIPDLFVMKSKIERETSAHMLTCHYEVVESVVTSTIEMGDLKWHPVR